MAEPILLSHEELEFIAERMAAKAVSQILASIGIKPKDVDPSITQNAAVKLMKDAGVRKGLPSLRRAMFEGRVRWEKKDFNNPRGRVYVKQKDVLKLINN
jgi:hypothetical protein